MKHALRAVMLIAALTMPASAMADPVKPALKVTPALKVNLQPEVTRKLDLLKGAGIAVIPEALKTPTTLSVRAPVKDAATYLSFRGVQTFEPNVGRMVLLGSQPHDAAAGGTGVFAGVQPRIPEINTSAATISFRAATGFRYILDCKVSGADEYRFAEFTSADGAAWRSTRVRPVDGRVTLLLLSPLQGTGKKAFVTGFTKEWSLESCEITPVG